MCLISNHIALFILLDVVLLKCFKIIILLKKYFNVCTKKAYTNIFYHSKILFNNDNTIYYLLRKVFVPYILLRVCFVVKTLEIITYYVTLSPAY